MDIATLVGLIVGSLAVVVGIIVGKGSPVTFFDAPSVFIVVVGSIASTFVAYPMDRAMKLSKLLLGTLSRKTSDPAQLVPVLVGLARRARREGLLALEAEMENVDDEFLRRGMQLVVDGSDPETLKEILETDIALMRGRLTSDRAIVDYMAKVAPAFGMIGTLIGLVLMLKNLKDQPDKIGENMAVALITTFYGTLMANLVLTPMGNKIGLRSEEEMLNYTIMLEGIMSIQSGENPGMVEEKLKVFLPPDQRDRVSAAPTPGEE